MADVLLDACGGARLATTRVRRRATSSAIALIAGALVSGARAGDACEAQWSAQFAGAGIQGEATELFVVDGGAGSEPVMVVAGQFTGAGGTTAKNIARFDGWTWSTLGAGLKARVSSLVRFDFGEGERLVAAGNFDLIPGAQLAQWDGAQWGPVPPGAPHAWMASLGVYEGELFISGAFFMQGSSYFARWSRSAWTGVPPGLASVVWDQMTYDDGRGPVLVVAGIPFIQGIPGTLGIAKWNGATWSAFGTGINGEGRALAVFDDGDGPALYVGGAFMHAGGMSAPRIARWKDGAWSAVGAGFNNRVNALAVFDDGSGPALYAGGDFITSDGAAVSHLARWRGGPGAVWEPVGGGVEGGNVHALAVFDDDGEGPIPPALYVAGDFLTAGGVPSPGIARWGRCATCIGDIDGSGVVDGSDLAVVLGQWGASDCGEPTPCEADLDDSGAVDGSDLAIVLGAWGSCVR